MHPRKSVMTTEIGLCSTATESWRKALAWTGNRSADIPLYQRWWDPELPSNGHDDLAGNVWEWMEDMYDPFAYTRPGADRGEPGSCDEILAAQNKLEAAFAPYLAAR